MTGDKELFFSPALGFSFPIEAARQVVEWAVVNETPTPPIILKKLSLIHCIKRNGYTNFVETGTYLGDTANVMAANGCRVFTIELSQKLYEQALTLFAANDRVTCLQGDSAAVLAEVIERLDAPALFWLDGHYSGGITAGAELESPIMGELDILRRARETRSELIDRSTIYVDDLEAFGTEGYPTLEELQEVVRTSLPRHTFRIVNNALRIVPNL